MRTLRRIVGWIIGIVAGTLLLAACGFIYMTSNVPTPAYTVIETAGEIELRDYPELIVAEITTNGTRGEAVRAGFSPLAGYIFAKERAGDKIAMTAPVTQQAGDGNGWTVQFIMPEGYTLETLPRPAGSEVRLDSEPPMRRAAIRFSGSWSDESFAEQEASLRAWLDQRDLAPQGPPIYAYYNDPFTPGFMRRNEVLFNVAP